MARKEENKNTFSAIVPFLGKDVALFCLCAANDRPYLPDVEAENWEEYVATLEECSRGYDQFKDGKTEVEEAIRKGFNEQERWEAEWGDGDDDHPYSEKDYKRLDELKRIMTGQLGALGDLTHMQEDTARQCSIWTLQCEKLSAKGDKDSISTAKMLDEMKRKNLEDCNMRNKDILPSQQHRLAGIVQRLEKEYGVGVSMTRDEVLEVFFKWCKKNKYPQTVDAAHHAMLYMEQTMAKNSDMPVPQDLSEGADLTQFAEEFADEPNDMENEIYPYLGIVRNDE